MNVESISMLLLGVSALVVLLVHAFLVLCESSMIKIRYGQAQGNALEALRLRPDVSSLLENGYLVGRVSRIGKTLCAMCFGLLLLPLIDGLSAGTGWVASGSLFLPPLLFICAFFVYFVISEIVPRGASMRDPVLGLRRSYRVFLLFRLFVMPTMLLLRGLKRLHFKRIGVDGEDELDPLDVDVQIRAMGEDSTELSPVVRKIFDRTLQMQNLVVHDVLLPRNQVVIYDLNESLEANLRTMKEAGHTRFPLCRGDLDACIGIIHIKDIFRQRGEANQVNPQDLKRSISQFPQETPLEEALQRMLRAKFHMALVSDEFGRVIGLITLESILESLVGDIQDEFDSDEEQVIPMQEPDTFKVSGLTPLHDIEEALGLEVSNEDVSTIGGLVTAELGYIPEIGETLCVSGMRIKVIEVDERRVISVHLEKEGVALSNNPEPD